MKKHTVRILSLLCTLVLAFGLAGCGNRDDSSGSPAKTGDKAGAAEATPTPEFVYQAEYQTILKDSEDQLALSAMTDEGTYIIKMEKVGEEIPEGVTPEYEGQYDIKEARLGILDFSGKLTMLDNYEPMPRPENTENKRDFTSYAYPEMLALDESGNLVLLEEVFVSYSDAPEEIRPEDVEYGSYTQEKTTYTLRLLDPTGNSLSSAALDLSSNGYLQRMVVDGEGNVVINTDTSLSVYRTDGEKLCDIPLEGNYVYDIAKLRDGRVAALFFEMSGDSRMCVRTLDIKAKALSDESWEVGRQVYSLLPGGGEYDLYYSNGTNLCGYTLEDESEHVLFNWLDADVNADNLWLTGIGADGVVRAFLGNYSKSDKQTIEMITVKEVPYTSVPVKEHLTLATLYSSYEARDAVIDFNRSSDKYRIDILDYYTMCGNDIEAALSKLNTEIMAGNMPDLIELSDMPYTQLAAKGLLEDLYPYIDADPAFNREDFFENVLGAYEVDGKLCAAPSGFGVVTLEGASSVVGDTPGWTYDDYYAALATMPEGCEGLDYTVTRERMLEVGVAIDMDTYMSWSTGECNFDSEAFKQLLEFCKQFRSEKELENFESSEETSNAYRIAHGMQMLQQASFFTFNEYSTDNLFGAESTLIGFPNYKGEQGSVLQGIDTYGISSSCTNKEAAWEFLRTFLTKDYQLESFNFPTNKEAFNELLADAKEIEYEKDANGNYKLDENGERIRQVIGTGYDGTNYIEIYSGISEELAERIVQLVNSTTKLLNYDESILNIVSEQAQAYFEGQKTADEVAKLVQSKANIYVNEQR